MPSTRDPLAAYNIATEVLHCIEERLEEPVTRSCVVAGNVAWDDCECGQLTVSIGRMYPSNSFPIEAEGGVTTSTKCGQGFMVIEYAATILRCAIQPSDPEDAPSCEDLATDAYQVVKDMSEVRAGVLCCLMAMAQTPDPNENILKITDYLVGVQQIIGPEGACVGSQLTFFVGILNICPCA